jgi:hypothetical protein
LLTLSNDQQPKDEDVIFSNRKLTTQYPLTAKMFSEIQDKYIPNVDMKLSSIVKQATNWLSLKSYPNSNLPVIVDESTVQINNYVRKLPPGKLTILINMNNSYEVLGKMIMRYACLLIGGQQWAAPLEIYKFVVDRYNVTIEGFASPINSQILYISQNLKYCSIFPDTDKPYGSLGDFFLYDFLGNSVYVNPPYVLDIMNSMANKVIQTCNNARLSSVRFFITVPEWTDAEYYNNLMSSSHLVFHYSFPKGKHYYVDTNNGFEKVTAYFGTHLFILAVNIVDTYDDFINYTNGLFH